MWSYWWGAKVHKGYWWRRTCYQDQGKYWYIFTLCHGRLVTLVDSEKSWVNFKYEWLSNFCYWCGCVTHVNKKLWVWIRSKGSLTSDQQQYGSSLRLLHINQRVRILSLCQVTMRIVFSQQGKATRGGGQIDSGREGTWKHHVWATWANYRIWELWGEH